MKTTLALIVSCVGLALVANHRTPLHAQAPAATPRFEVASVKLSDPNAASASPIGAIPMILPPLGGRFSATNVPLRLLVRAAWEMPDFRIIGGPSWQTSQRFDISAKLEDGFSGTIRDVYPMVKALLADRFQLKTHTETRELPTYSLVISREDGRLGPKMKPSASKCEGIEAEMQKRVENALKSGPAGLAALMPKLGQPMTCAVMPAPAAGFGAITLKADGQPLLLLTQLLTEVTGRVVNDKTGLTGLYDFDITFDMQALLSVAQSAGINIPAGALANLPPSNAPSLLTALHEDLGLELDSDRGPVEVLVIDSAEMPTAD